MAILDLTGPEFAGSVATTEIPLKKKLGGKG
jgi:hypothetical protein